MLGKKESCVHRHSLSWSRDTFCWDRKAQAQTQQMRTGDAAVAVPRVPYMGAGSQLQNKPFRSQAKDIHELPYATSSSTHFGQPNLLEDPLPSSSVTSAHQHPQSHLPNTLLFHELPTLATTLLLPGSGSLSKHPGSVCAHLSIAPSFWGEWAGALTVGENQGADNCLAYLGLSLHPVSMTTTSLLPPFSGPRHQGCGHRVPQLLGDVPTGPSNHPREKEQEKKTNVFRDGGVWGRQVPQVRLGGWSPSSGNPQLRLCPFQDGSGIQKPSC